MASAAAMDLAALKHALQQPLINGRTPISLTLVELSDPSALGTPSSQNTLRPLCPPPPLFPGEKRGLSDPKAPQSRSAAVGPAKWRFDGPGKALRVRRG